LGEGSPVMCRIFYALSRIFGQRFSYESHDIAIKAETSREILRQKRAQG